MSLELSCPKCGKFNNNLEIQCSNCDYQFKESVIRYCKGEEQEESESASFYFIPETALPQTDAQTQVPNPNQISEPKASVDSTIQRSSGIPYQSRRSTNFLNNPRTRKSFNIALPIIIVICFIAIFIGFIIFINLDSYEVLKLVVYFGIAFYIILVLYGVGAVILIISRLPIFLENLKTRKTGEDPKKARIIEQKREELMYLLDDELNQQINNQKHIKVISPVLALCSLAVGVWFIIKEGFLSYYYYVTCFAISIALILYGYQNIMNLRLANKEKERRKTS